MIPFEILHEWSYPYIEKYAFYSAVKIQSSQIYELLSVFETAPETIS